jgi:hypothetical protein
MVKCLFWWQKSAEIQEWSSRYRPQTFINKTTIYVPMTIKCCGDHLSPCETVSRHIRCWKWSSPTSVQNSKLANASCNMSGGRAAGSWRVYWGHWRCKVCSCRQTLPFSRPHSKKSGGVTFGYLVGQRSFEIIRSPEHRVQLCIDTSGHHTLHLTWRDAVSQGPRLQGTYSNWSPSMHKLWLYCWKSGASTGRIILLNVRRNNQHTG